MMTRIAALRTDAAVLRQMLRGMPKSSSHAQNLQGFYRDQAQDYDRFRESLLCGREALIRRLLGQLPAQARVVELGGGTGRNLDFFGDRLRDIANFDLVDLCPALLECARERLAHHPQVRMIEADATTWQPDAPVDCVYFSYALTMIPDWRAALANALAMLKPGGLIGAVDFYTSSAQPAAGLARHNAFTRRFWPLWFAHDGVRLDPAHLSTLREHLIRHELSEHHAAVPYLPLIRVPYYIFVGQRSSAE